jgi:hypothetical protein
MRPLFLQPHTAAGRSMLRQPIAVARDKADDHPMGLFVLLALGAFLAFMLAPVEGRAFAKAEPVATAKETVKASSKSSRLPAKSEKDRVCAGQAWGNESVECVAAIARENGADVTPKIRIINAD